MLSKLGGGQGTAGFGFIGNRFTWCHGTNMESRKAARLDRALGCDAWRRLFPLPVVHHLSHSHSDHCPLLLDLNGSKSRRLGERPFKFQAAWMHHKEFANWVAEEWSYQGDLNAVLR